MTNSALLDFLEAICGSPAYLKVGGVLIIIEGLAFILIPIIFKMLWSKKTSIDADYDRRIEKKDQAGAIMFGLCFASFICTEFNYQIAAAVFTVCAIFAYIWWRWAFRQQ
jgi:predicted membrane-bound spermidine synthase